MRWRKPKQRQRLTRDAAALFDPNRPVDSEDLLFGRSKLLERIDECNESAKHVLLVGPKKVGKTSILNVVCSRLGTTHRRKKVFRTSAGRKSELRDLCWDLLSSADIDPAVATDAREQSLGVTAKLSPGGIGGETEGIDSRTITRIGPSERLSPQYIADALKDRTDTLVLDGAEKLSAEAYDDLTSLVEALLDVNSRVQIVLATRELSGRLLTEMAYGPSSPFEVCCVEPLSESDIGEFLAVCGGERLHRTFPPSAVLELFDASGGHPGLAKTIAGRCIRSALQEGRELVSREHLLREAECCCGAARESIEQSLRQHVHPAGNVVERLALHEAAQLPTVFTYGALKHKLEQRLLRAHETLRDSIEAAIASLLPSAGRSVFYEYPTSKMLIFSDPLVRAYLRSKQSGILLPAGPTKE